MESCNEQTGPYQRYHSSSGGQKQKADHVSRSTTEQRDRSPLSWIVLVRQTVWILVVSVVVKVLLLPAKPSTDFEVHRNWMAIARRYNTPAEFGRWYFEETSQWTVDYPPGFMWWEYLLAHIAPFTGVSDHSLEISSSPIHEPSVVMYQKLSVIFWDLILYAGLIAVGRTYIAPGARSSDFPDNRLTRLVVLMSLLLLHPCLLIIDHMHFQYNGGMLGILLLCMAALGSDHKVLGVLLYTFLLLLKHLYVFAAPVIGVYLLRRIWLEASENSKYWHRRATYALLAVWKIATPAILLITVTIWPVIKENPTKVLLKILERLMPWDRGLTHAYWAPNVWAIYNTLDRIFVKIIFLISRYHGGAFDLTHLVDPIALEERSTSGVVRDLGNHSHAVLPSIRPLLCHILFVIFLLPLLLRIWQQNRSYALPYYISFSAWCYFMFEWHVHEKAVIYILVPLVVGVGDTAFDARLFHRMSFIFGITILPLIQNPLDSLVATILVFGYHYLSWISLETHHLAVQRHRCIAPTGLMSVFALYGQPEFYLKAGTGSPDNVTKSFMVLCRILSGLFDSSFYFCWLCFVLAVYNFYPFLVPTGMASEFEFLPLMLISVSCALGVVCTGLELWLLTVRRQDLLSGP